VRRGLALACALALGLPAAAADATRIPGGLRAARVVGGAYTLDCTAGACVVDAEATAAAVAAQARPMIAEMLASMPASATVDGRVFQRPDLDAAVAAFTQSVVARIDAAHPAGASTRAVPPAPYFCGTNLNASYTKNHQNLFFYTQSYYTGLSSIDTVMCTPTDVAVSRMLVCSTFGFVAGFPSGVAGYGLAVRIDGTLNDLCVYPLTPSHLGLLPNTVWLLRVVLGDNAWAVVGPDGTYLDD